MTLPNFIVIGPGKTGSTWLYQCLAAHPDVRLARHTKETIFFNEYYDRGLGWYEHFFSGFEGAPAIGEVSNNYFFSSEAPYRIAKHLANVRLISILRDPVDRLLSAYHYNEWNLPTDKAWEQRLAHRSQMISNNFYDEFLAKWLEVFPPEQILVLLYDDIKNRPEFLLEQLYGFIGADPAFRPPAMNERVLPAANPRNAAVFAMAKRVAQWLRDRDAHWLLTWAKFSPVVQKVLTKKADRDKRERFPQHIQEQLQAVFRPHIDRLEGMIGRDLSAWK